MSWLQDYGLVFDIVISLLLMTAIAYAIALNRKLNVLRAARGDIEKLFADFSAATGRAEGGLQALKQGSADASVSLAKNVTDACRLAEEMAFLVAKGNEIADRLEVAITASRKVNQAQVHGGSPEAAAAVPDGAAATERRGIDAMAPPAAPEKAAPRGIARFTRRKLSGADSELMRALQTIR
jgi:hypothetical protein